MNQAEILEKARELGMMIAESDEFKKLKETEQAQLADPDAQQMMADYNAKREEFAQIASRDDLTKEDWEKLNMNAQAEFIKLCQNENIKNYLDANQLFQDLISKVNSTKACCFRTD